METAGPSPSQYSLLSIGACLVDDPERGFYVELRPVSLDSVPEAAEVHGLSLEELARSATPPVRAMAEFESWLAGELPPGAEPRFAGFNAAFDWMFVNDYFHRYLGHNPFGHAALDMKSFYMGATGVSWSQTTFGEISERYHLPARLTHNALQDARDQAAVFRHMLEEGRDR